MIFKLILPEQIHVVVPLVQTMEKEPISDAILLQRFREMTEQNYECVGGFLEWSTCGGFWHVVLYKTLLWSKC